MYNAIFINVFLIVSLLLRNILNKQGKFNGRDSHDVITYNYASYVCKSMVDKNRIYKCISKYKFLYCKQDNHISNEVGGSDAGGTQIFASGIMDQCTLSVHCSMQRYLQNGTSVTSHIINARDWQRPIDCKYKNKKSKENAVLIKIITLYLNIWTQKTSVNRLM